MDFHCLSPAIATLVALLLMIHRVWKLLMTNHKRKGKSVPEPSGAWPLIGHLLLLKDQVPAYLTFATMADKYGPIFAIRVGVRRVLIISSWEAAKECLRTNDKVFLNRPSSAASKFLCYNNALFALCPYGLYWRDIRKISIFELLSNTRLDHLKHARISEMEIAIRNLYSFCCDHGKSTSSLSSSAVDMSEWFFNVIMTMMMRMVTRRRLEHEESQKLNKAIKRFIYLLGVSVISDVIPFLEWLDLQGHVRSMKNTAKDCDNLVRSWFEEHLQSRRDGQAKEECSFINAMFSSLDNYEVSKRGHKETIVKATALNMIIGGTHATSGALAWSLSLLLNHRKVLQKAQEELEKHVGKERWVDESDFKNLPYLKAIIKETLRLYPAIPLSIPRESMEDCSVGGFHVPKGTVLFVNMWKLHRDPRVWLNPCEFQPERFLSCNGGFNFDVRGQHFEYIPFSSGRRSCPGTSSAMQMGCLILARLLQGFNLSTPMNAPVDMTSSIGATLTKATPLQVILSPRLPHHLYQL